MTQLYNAGVYGQSVTRLVDCVVCPATRILEMKAMDLDKEVKELDENSLDGWWTVNTFYE